MRKVTLKYEKKLIGRKEAKRSENGINYSEKKRKEAKRRYYKQKYQIYSKVTLATKQMHPTPPPLPKNVKENLQ